MCFCHLGGYLQVKRAILNTAAAVSAYITFNGQTFIKACGLAPVMIIHGITLKTQYIGYRYVLRTMTLALTA